MGCEVGIVATDGNALTWLSFITTAMPADKRTNHPNRNFYFNICRYQYKRHAHVRKTSNGLDYTNPKLLLSKELYEIQNPQFMILEQISHAVKQSWELIQSFLAQWLRHCMTSKVPHLRYWEKATLQLLLPFSSNLQ